MAPKRLLTASLLLLGPSTAQAQDLGFITKIFSNVHSVLVTGQGGRFLNSDELRTREWCGVCGTGLEVMFDVTPLHAETAVHLELGLGINHLTGVAAESTGDSLDLRGALRTNPTISARAWLDHGNEHPLLRRLVPYAGINAGLVEAVNLRGYDAQGRQYTLDTKTLEMGGHFGVYIAVMGPFGVFVEPSVTRRRFGSIDYKLPSNLTAVPEGWPRSFNADSWQLRIGAQFRLKDDAPPRVTGLWIPTSLNGQVLPAVMSHAPASGGSSTRIELVNGALVLEPRGNGFTLSLVQRRTRLAADGKVVEIVEPLIAPPEQTGTYTIEGNELTLRFAGGAHRGSISPTEIRLQLSPTNHLVVFKRQN